MTTSNLVALSTVTFQSNPETATKGITEPLSYNDAMSRSHSRHWLQAMNNEYQSLLTNDTWSLVPCPNIRKIIKCRWVFKTQLDEKGVIVKHKARLTAKGYSQIQGVDYDETFAPVASQNSLRTVLSIAASNDWKINQADVETAFLLSDIDQNDLHMEQPQSFIIKGK